MLMPWTYLADIEAKLGLRSCLTFFCLDAMEGTYNKDSPLAKLLGLGLHVLKNDAIMAPPLRPGKSRIPLGCFFTTFLSSHLFFFSCIPGTPEFCYRTQVGFHYLFPAIAVGSYS
jgi:hypothetical protein